MLLRVICLNYTSVASAESEHVRSDLTWASDSSPWTGQRCDRYSKTLPCASFAGHSPFSSADKRTHTVSLAVLCVQTSETHTPYILVLFNPRTGYLGAQISFHLYLQPSYNGIRKIGKAQKDILNIQPTKYHMPLNTMWSPNAQALGSSQALYRQHGVHTSPRQ